MRQNCLFRHFALYMPGHIVNFINDGNSPLFPNFVLEQVIQFDLLIHIVYYIIPCIKNSSVICPCQVSFKHAMIKVQ
ncbi:hypothetical protein MBAV_001266 [Candidatus Magnetobacterium bavaricum]|uniref:Uncharacterized protein n=1 Tax=Candidatus Magnetobacterium bavaricum TaxID=29290 RepID=A0A0F3GXF0_9BACT|nr:hypothetical protein MBAV_001266 [Candidatus Magnetobacterium bavaricum]